MTTSILILILVLAALVLIIAEICTPSFGLLGLCATGCLFYAAYECFTVSQWLGGVFVAACVVGVPVYLSVMMKVMPNTPLGRWLILKQVKAATGEGLPESAANSALIGRDGRTETVLRPVGAVRVDGRRVIATAEDSFIEANVAVKVVKASGANVVVRPQPETDDPQAL